MEQSYDIAMKIADNHRKLKLVDLIEEAKEAKFSADDDDDDDESSRESAPQNTSAIERRPRISPDSSERLGKRSLDDAGARQVRGRHAYA